MTNAEQAAVTSDATLAVIASDVITENDASEFWSSESVSSDSLSAADSAANTTSEAVSVSVSNMDTASVVTEAVTLHDVPEEMSVATTEPLLCPEDTTTSAQNIKQRPKMNSLKLTSPIE